jgi:glycosyltransferase involved in cell wall biosynthesis
VAPTEPRVLHVVEAFGGGLFEVVRLIATGIAGHGVGTAIAYGRRPETPDRVREQIDQRVELFAMPWTSRTLKPQLVTARRLRRLVQEWKPDVVHLHSSFAGVVGALTVPRSFPTIYTPHAYSFTMDTGLLASAAYRWAERLVARRVTVVAAASQSEALLARTEAGAGTVEVVENGIPELDPESLPSVPGRPGIQAVAIGRIGGQRRPEACARILGAVKDVADVCWIGGGPDLSTGRKALDAEAIPVTGWLHRDAVLERLGGATAYLHWTAWDGLPLSILEAMARDVVVVASDIAPNRDVLGPTQVRATEAEAAELLRAMLTDPARRSRALDEQRRRRGRYGAARMVTAWLDLYRRVAGGGATAP